MDKDRKSNGETERTEVSVQLKLAALWASFMFLYIYVDYFHLYMPNKIEHITRGLVFKFDITQGFLLAALASVTIPALMIFLSVAMPVRLNRRINLTVAVIYIPYTLFNLAGEIPWMHMVFAAVAETILLCLIIAYVWNWQVINTTRLR